MSTQRGSCPIQKKTQRGSSNLEKEETLLTLPCDLVTEILPRLPAKSVLRFRCLSKLCDSIIRSPTFTESFFNISSSRPKLLFTCLKDGKTFFFSSLPLNPGNSSTIKVDFHMSFPINYPCEVSRPVCGLVCGLYQEALRLGSKLIMSVPLLCNPSTGQYLALPKGNTYQGVNSFFGYDPIGKQFKVLYMIYYQSIGASFRRPQVLTLGTDETWRMINCDVTHGPIVVNNCYRQSEYDRICINGVLYYLANVLANSGGFPDVVCFDVRSRNSSL